MGSRLFGVVCPGPDKGTIFMISGKNLIPGLQFQATHDRIDGGGRIGYENQVIARTTDEGPQGFPGSPEMFIDGTPHELYRFLFQASLPLLVIFENRSGASTKRTVIKESNTGI
jgi:hypothetical protein